MERVSMRFVVAAAVLVAAFLVAVPLAPAARAQGIPNLTGIENFRLSAVDTDGNGRYEALMASFNATVTVGGNFRFQARLTTSTYGLSFVNNTDVNLPVGTHALSVSIPGRTIFVSNTNGPYGFGLAVIAITDAGEFLSNGYPYVSTTTDAYNATDFEPPEATLGAGITDEGVDTDGDGLYNFLVVHVPVVVTRAVSAKVQACLGCVDGGFYGGDSLPTEFLDLAPGTHRLDVRWDGVTLRARPLPTDGYSSVLVALLMPGTMPMDPLVVNQTRYILSRAYASSEFETPSASLPPTTPTLTPQDTNGNGRADFLVVHVPVVIRVTGRYVLEVQLTPTGDPRTVAIGGTLVSLLPGNRTVDVSLSGIALSRFTGTTVLAMAILMREGSTAYGDTASRTWSLPNFSPSDFESRPVSALTLNLPAGNVSCGIAYAYDPANRFLAVAYPSGYVGSQQLQLDLYDGTFDLIVLDCGTGLAAMAETVAIHGPTTLEVTYPSAARPTIRIDYSVPAWNETDVATSADLGSSSALYRLIADFFGNADGFADDGELRLVGALGLAPYYGPYYYPSWIRADNRSLPPTASALVSISGEGEIVSSEPLHLSVRTVFRTANPPAPGDRHRLVIQTPYGSPTSAKVEVTVNLGASFGGNLSVRSRMVVSGGDGFTWPANATVTRTGPRSWSIDVGGVPPNEPADVLLEITADAYGTAPPPVPTDFVSYLTSPLSVSLILLAVAAAVMYLASRRRKTPKAPA